MKNLVEALKYACRRARNYRESDDPTRRCDGCNHYSQGREAFCKFFECKVDPQAVCERWSEPGSGRTTKWRGPSLRSMGLAP